MKKWIPLFLFLVFAHDVAIDVFEADCQDKAGSVACHSCICQNHFVKSVEKTQEKVVSAAEYIPAPDPLLSLNEFSKSFFHPPKVLA